jgi:GT2 family glycosyltransferase
MTRLSVIIPAFNALPEVLRCQRTLLDTSDRALTEVLIQDDASSLYNGPLLFGEDVCQRNSPNLGFPGNCNAGAARAHGDVLFFVNQDVYVEREQAGWDARLLEFFDAHPQVGIVGVTLLFPEGNVQSVGGLFDARCQPFHEALGYRNPDWTPINTARKMSWVTGAAFAIRRGLWNMLGGFDTIYGRGYFEDVSMCVMAQLEGAEVWHLPTIRFIHEVGSTGGNPNFHRNAMEFKRRYVDTKYVTPDVNTVKVGFWE